MRNNTRNGTRKTILQYSSIPIWGPIPRIWARSSVSRLESLKSVAPSCMTRRRAAGDVRDGRSNQPRRSLSSRVISSMSASYMVLSCSSNTLATLLPPRSLGPCRPWLRGKWRVWRCYCPSPTECAGVSALRFNPKAKGANSTPCTSAAWSPRRPSRPPVLHVGAVA